MSTKLVDNARALNAAHQSAVTRYCHFIGVPLLYFSIIIFLGFIRLSMPNIFEIDFGWILSVVCLFFYFFEDWRLALACTPIFFLLNFSAGFISHSGINSVNFMIFAVLFLSSIVCIFLGFLASRDKDTNIRQMPERLFMAPLVFIAEIFFHFGKLYGLHQTIYEDTKEESEIE